MATGQDAAQRSRRTGQPGVILGVLGATGGVGASSLAAAAAVRAGVLGRRTVLVDGQPWGGGLDVLVGLDVTEGLRWRDLSRARGSLDGDSLRRALPADGELAVLSWGRGLPPEQLPAPAPVLTALAAAADLVVVDLPRPGTPGAAAWWHCCDALLVVATSALSGLAPALLTLASLSRESLTCRTVVVRAGQLGNGGRSGLALPLVAETLGVRVVSELPDDAAIAASLMRGQPVGSRPGPLVDAADRVLAEVLTSGQDAA